MRPGVLCLFFSLALMGCDGDPPAPPPPKPVVLGVDVQSVTPLPPGRRTHIAPTEAGQTFWVQEADGGRETVFAISDGGLPTATRFTNAAVVEALGEPGASGSLQSLAEGPDGKLYFYFTGGKGRRQLAALGTFSPLDGKTQIVADTATLSQESGLGDSLALARGSVMRSGDLMWLWLRHEDGFALLRLDASHAGAPLRRPFERLSAAAGETPPRLTSQGEDLAVGAGNTLVYLDRTDGRLWKIDSVGEVAVLRDLVEMPAKVTTPALDEAGRMVVFAPDGPTFKETPDDIAMLLKRPTVEYPAVVMLGNPQVAIGRGKFTGPAGANLRALEPSALFRDRSSWLAYDAQTGELLRIRVVER